MVSTANVAQLAVDLMIATLSLVRVAVLDSRCCVPVVGAREDGLNGITTPIECEHWQFRFCQYVLRQPEYAKSIWSPRPRLPCHPTKVPDFEGWSNAREARACS